MLQGKSDLGLIKFVPKYVLRAAASSLKKKKKKVN